MKETENNKSQVKLIVGIILLSVCVSIATSSIVIKILAPTLSTSTSISTTLPAIQPSSTLYVLPTTTSSPNQIQRSEFEENLRENNGFEIETNLLQNSGFENDLLGWTYLDNQAGINIFETNGVNGNSFCSRRSVFAPQTDLLSQEWIGFAQRIPLDPTQTYFFSAWLKLNETRNVLVYARFYNGSTEGAIQYLGNFGRTQPETSNGWFFIHNIIDPTPLVANHVEIQFVHGKLDINSGTPPTFSTFCIDDVFLGAIVK